MSPCSLNRVIPQLSAPPPHVTHDIMLAQVSHPWEPCRAGQMLEMRERGQTKSRGRVVPTETMVQGGGGGGIFLRKVAEREEQVSSTKFRGTA